MSQTAPHGDPRALNQAAMAALRAGDALGARDMLAEALASGAVNEPLYLNLAAAERALGNIPAAITAVDSALKLDPLSFMALLTRASLLERRGETKQAAAAYGAALTQAPRDEHLDPATRRAVEHGRRVQTDYLDALDQSLKAATESARSLGRSAETRRMNGFIERLTRRQRPYHQDPAQFCYPGLPAIEFYDREMFDWLPGIEAQTQTIGSELVSALAADAAGQAGFVPYTDYPNGVPLNQWAELNRSRRWSALHLWKDGKPVEANAARCPKTMTALEACPQPRTQNRSPAAMFSLLQPKTRIPAHTGVSNTRLVVHLPLIVPPGCGFRVGNETREWKVGEGWVFDDTIEHEAWNDSADPRTILIFDIWSPFLSADEQLLVAEVMKALDAFNGFVPEDGL